MRMLRINGVTVVMAACFLMRREGEMSVINRIYRLYLEERFIVPKRRVRCKAIGARATILVEARSKDKWFLDFVHDQMTCGRRFRTFNLVTM